MNLKVDYFDSPEMGESRRRELDMPPDIAAALGRSALAAAENGYYLRGSSTRVDWRESVLAACSAKVSIPPDAPLPDCEPPQFAETVVEIANETTLGASRRLVERGARPLTLNFANGVVPGGGFLVGARAQEETLCRSSALFQTLRDDDMYEAHRKRPREDSTDWAIYSPDVPVFRTDDGRELEQPWLLSFLTCAAPYAPTVGQPESGDLLQQRIHRVLAIARAYRHEALVLGAWGCGAFGNDVARTACDFHNALDSDFRGAFSHIVFAITDWSPERRTLRPFYEAFKEASPKGN